VSIQAVDTSAIKDAVRQVVNEELALARAQASAETAAESAEAEPTPEIHATLASGRQYIEQAIQAGRWGPEQAEYVHSLGAGLTGEQFHGLVQPLSSAINAGRLRVDVEGPPF
jgi:hypothetical protein